MSHSSSRVHPDLLAKQQEHLMLQRLLEATTKLLSRAEELADSGDVMAEGGAGESLEGAWRREEEEGRRGREGGGGCCRFVSLNETEELTLHFWVGCIKLSPPS